MSNVDFIFDYHPRELLTLTPIEVSTFSQNSISDPDPPWKAKESAITIGYAVYFSTKDISRNDESTTVLLGVRTVVILLR